MFEALRRWSRSILRLWQRHGGGRIVPLLSTVRLAGLLLAGFSLWLFAKLAEEVFEQETQRFDTQILLTIHQHHSSWLDRSIPLFTNIGAPSVLVGMAVGLGIYLFWKQQRSEAMTLAIGAIGALLLNTLLKNLFARARPELWSRVVDVKFYSFPSGHAMLSMVVYGLLGYLLALQYPQQRGWIAGITVLLILAIGFSRLYLGVHWPTDVLAGYAAGLVWLVACILSLEIWRQRHQV